MFDRGFERFQLGYGSAVAVILFLVCARRRAAYQRFVLRRDIDGALTTGLARWRPSIPTSPRDGRRSEAGRPRRVAGVDCRWALLLVLAGVIVIPHPVRRPRRVPGQRPARRQSRSACPTRGSSRTTPTCSGPTTLLAAARQQRPDRRASRRSSSLVVRLARRVRLRPRQRSPAARCCSRCSRSACCSRRPSRSCRCSSWSATSAARQPARRRAAPGRVRAAAHDHHPAAVLPEHPGRARGRRPDRRLRHVRLLLADPAAARPGRRWRRSASSRSWRAGTRSSCRS